MRQKWTGELLLGLVLAGALIAGMTAQSPRTAIPRTATTILVLGAHANAWSATAVGIAGTSTALDTQYAPFCSAFGNAGAATTISAQLSANNTNFYTSTTSQVLAGSSDFGFTFTPGARYVRLISSAAATITATLECKSQ